ncbi:MULTISPECIES: YqaA family protein [Halomonadaceae]|jgi:membrane protein YqaA with SNARE-associated domain|uniref:Alkaline phosphatase n=1 Tax=Halomonas campaniensis TaxID=213554 RepID=A0A246S0E2_9GAMM|nr:MULTISPECIES: VTT domain-containing protein [Halomonas]MBS3669204.1 DedA family protein [Halomonas boliviensis]OWV29889.1 alkaline phosphatase [Halomonas campaniensis]
MAMASKRTKQWFERINRSKNMLWLLGTLSFLETIILPIPIELVLIPLMAVNRQRLWLLATVTTAGCLIASLIGYSIGLLLYQSVGTWFIEFMGMEQSYQSFQAFFDQYGFAAILAIGILPIPFQVAMITAGLSGYPIMLFVLATLIARGLRYFGLAWLVHRFGHGVLVLWKRHALVTSLVAGAAVLAIALGMQALARLVF